MFYTILFIVFAIASFIAGKVLSIKFGKKEVEVDTNGNSIITPNKGFKYTGYFFTLFFSSLMLLSNFIIMTPANKYAEFNKRILGSQLENGAIVAINGEMGPQSWIKREGISIIPFVNFIYSVEFKDIVVVPNGMLLTLSAKDGKPLSTDEFFAPDWYNNASAEDKKELSKADFEQKMLDAKFFLTHGGKKGPQVNVLKPGKYAINTNLWSFKLEKATKIDTGEVGVVTSKVGKIYHLIERTTENSNISVPLVDKGYIGVWKDTLTAGSYYLNPYAYKVQPVDMRAQVWRYKGGYMPRENDISVSKKGEITYTVVKHDKLEVPKNAADSAIAVKTKDKYTVYIEVRAQIQPDSKHASRIVAGVGSLQMVEDKVITPAVRSVLRNIGMNYEAVEFVDKRVEIESKCKAELSLKAQQAGVPIKEFFFGNIDLPPAVLTPQKVEELSKKMQKAYVQQNITYLQLVKTNETKATADQQGELVKAKILKEKAEYERDASKIRGEGKKLFAQQVADGERYSLEEVAKGQEAQKKVLGANKTFELEMWKATLKAVKDNPEIATSGPQILIQKNGSGGDSAIEEGAAIMVLQQLKKSQKYITNTKQTVKK